jgi:hypothetical protein
LFFKKYKEDDIVVYPETIFFRFARLVPISWIEGNINKLKDTVKEKGREAVTGAVTYTKDRIKEATG